MSFAWQQDYEIANVNIYTPYDMHDPTALYTLRKALEEIILEEGPIHLEVLIQRVREAWPRPPARAGSRIRGAVSRALNRLRPEIVADRGFFGSAEQFTVPRVRTPTADPKTERVVGRIHITELAEAVCRVVSEGHLVTRDEITLRVARLFGWERAGSDIQSGIKTAIARAVQKRQIARVGDAYSITT